MSTPEVSPIGHSETVQRQIDATAYYQELAGVALRHAQTVLRDPHDAEDIAAETMRKVWQTNGFTNLESPIAYVATAARYAAYDLLRRYSQRPEASHEEFEDFLGAVAPEAVQITFDFERDAEARNTLARVGRAIGLVEQNFSKIGAEILRMTAQDMTPTEIGKILGMKPNAVSAQLYRSRAKLKEYLESGEV